MDKRSLVHRGFRVTAAFILVLICQGACLSRRPGRTDFLTPAGFLDCGIEGFTEANPEHIVNDIKEPFVVRRIQGKILDSSGDPIWFEDLNPLLEIRAFGASDATVRGVRADLNGNFRMEGVPEGPYCFKATMNGWQSVIGIIIVSKRANSKRSITFKLEIGV